MASSHYEKTITALLENLPQRTQEVLGRRYGLFGANPSTLEEIGERHGVTRERIRQIETNGFSQLRNDHAHIAAPVLRELERHLREHGGVRAEQHFFEDFDGRISPTALQFLLDLGESFTRYRETARRHAVWSLDTDAVSSAEELERAIVDRLTELGKELQEAEFWKLVEQEARRRRLSITTRAMQSWLGISRQIAKGPRKTWGLESWPEIVPHNVGDWASIVLHSTGKPMHFSDIVRGMNTLEGRKGRRAHLQTVHNELIKDPRFVLVGRGLYALRDWGFEPGTVRDVIAQILKQSKKPLGREEIIAQVANVRQVQTNTVILNLQNKSTFTKTADGRYTVRRG